MRSEAEIREAFNTFTEILEAKEASPEHENDCDISAGILGWVLDDESPRTPIISMILSIYRKRLQEVGQ
jgi:hypothetical protein